MKIDIDFEILQETQMSADDFLYLYLLHKKNYNYLSNLNLKPNLDQLQNAGYIKLGETPDQHFIRQEFIDLFSSNFDPLMISFEQETLNKMISPIIKNFKKFIINLY